MISQLASKTVLKLPALKKTIPKKFVQTTCYLLLQPKNFVDVHKVYFFPWCLVVLGFFVRNVPISSPTLLIWFNYVIHINSFHVFLRIDSSFVQRYSGEFFSCELSFCKDFRPLMDKKRPFFSVYLCATRHIHENKPRFFMKKRKSLVKSSKCCFFHKKWWNFKISWHFSYFQKLQNINFNVFSSINIGKCGQKGKFKN